MDFQCPHCTNRLSIPDQYAGTLMKCPICSKTFTAPNLAPQLPTNAPAPAPAPPASTEGYHLAVESPKAPPPPPSPAASMPAKAPASPPPAGATDYTGGFASTLDPKIVPWIAPGCLLVAFALLWFPWIGQFHPVPGYSSLFGVNVQSGWGTMLGGSSVDPLWADMTGYKQPTDWSLANGLMVLFFLLLLAAIPLSIVAAALPLLQISLPPAVEQLKPWRWAAVGGVILLAFLLLTLQTVMHFSLESQVRDRIAADFKGKLDGDQLTKDKLSYAAEITKAGLMRTSYLQLSWYLCLLALIGAALQLWLDRRGYAAPPPRLDLRW